MLMEISGLPLSGPNREKLRAPRDAFKDFARISYGSGSFDKAGYLRFDRPTPVTITGSLFYDIDHQPGVVGPVGWRPRTTWEVHPITEIVFR